MDEPFDSIAEAFNTVADALRDLDNEIRVRLRLSDTAVELFNQALKERNMLKEKVQELEQDNRSLRAELKRTRGKYGL